MTGLALEGIGKRFGEITALADVDLAIPDGSFVCFLGPSGCGKTTLLRIVAGLEQPTAGRVLIGDEDVTGVPTSRRGVGMVFQSLALFPHLDVGENIAYSLRIRGVPKPERDARVEELLELVRLSGYQGRHISQLSGGQRQRVAIARALATQPRLFLLDEPLSALDAKLREEMQVELRLLQQRLGVTTIMVTHDRREAMTIADFVVVMGDQRVQQVGAPLEIYRRPRNRFVADFMGDCNLLEAEPAGEGAVLLAGARYPLPGFVEANGGTVTVSVRPEGVLLAPAGMGEDGRGIGTVTFLKDLGDTLEAYIELDGAAIMALAPQEARARLAQGDRVRVSFAPDALHALED
ncbi:MAG: transporter ATP-binding protein [Rhodospirillales bacterium]|nr:transporter ATP-binding protein [Rhodospirillales bacterium]